MTRARRAPRQLPAVEPNGHAADARGGGPLRRGRAGIHGVAVLQRRALPVAVAGRAPYARRALLVTGAFLAEQPMAGRALRLSGVCLFWWLLWHQLSAIAFGEGSQMAAHLDAGGVARTSPAQAHAGARVYREAQRARAHARRHTRAHTHTRTHKHKGTHAHVCTHARTPPAVPSWPRIGPAAAPSRPSPARPSRAGPPRRAPLGRRSLAGEPLTRIRDRTCVS